MDLEKTRKLFASLCTEEMLDADMGIKVRAMDKEGYLVSYDFGLGFGMWTENGDHEYELSEHEIEILDEEDNIG